MITVKLRIGDLIEEEKHLIHINDSKGYPVYKSDLDKILDKMREQEWARQDGKAVELGSELYQHLDGDGILSGVLQKARSSGKPILFKAQVPQQWDSLPLELLCKDRLLFLDRTTHLVWEVSDRANLQIIEPKTDLPLKMLFMAASDEQDKSTLNYEVEEEKIYEATKKFSLDLEVEESGSLAGLESSIYEHKPEIIHITGHATISPEKGPVFLLETDEGEIELVTPKKLWEAMEDHPPTLLFLSGCSTGKSDRITGAYSFAREMVELGCPLVLGWSLPVQDISATIFAAALYESLSKENTLHKAISIARNKSDAYIKKAREANPGLTQAWPLLKVFAQASQFQELVKLDNPKTDHKPAKEVHYEHLGNKGVRVLKSGFIGRRRAIQQGLRILRGKQQGKYGLFIHGPGGVGKSCLSGKLLAKFPDHVKIIFHGELTASLIFEEISSLSKKHGWDAWQQILEKQISDEEKISLFFQLIGANQKILFLLDDFEQNLQQNTHSDWKLKEENQPAITALLNAVPIGNWSTQVLITSRYSFTQFDEQGKNASDVLHDLPLSSFNPTEQRKKLQYLPHIAKSEHQALYLKYAGGNARLLDMLEKSIAVNESVYDLQKLEEKLIEKQDEIRAKYLGEIIASVEGSAFKSFMQQVAVFRIPVPAEAISPIGNTETLERAVALTLIEKDISNEKQAKYVVNNLVREFFWEKLSEEKRKEAHGVAWNWYNDPAKISGKLVESQEAFHHAYQCEDNIGISLPAINICRVFGKNLQFIEQQEFTEEIVDLILKHLDQSQNQNTSYTRLLLGELGIIHQRIGNLDRALELYGKALDLIEENQRDTSIESSKILSNLANTHLDKGEIESGIELLEKSLKIALRHNETKPMDLAIKYINLGTAYADKNDFQQSLKHYNKSLDLLMDAGYEVHPSISAIYNNLGELYRENGEGNKALVYYKKSLDIEFRIHGGEHPRMATRYNNMGLASYQNEDWLESIVQFENAIKIRIKYFGIHDQYVGKTYANLARAQWKLGNNENAISYFKKSLLILMATLGLEHQDTTSAFAGFYSTLEAAQVQNPTTFITDWLDSLNNESLESD